MSIQTISSYLATQVKAVTGIDSRYVYEHEDSKLAGYPAVGITLKEWKGRFLDTARNERIYTYTIRIYQEVAKNNIGPATAESQLRALADALNAHFDALTDLGQNAVYALPIGGRTGWVQNQPIRTYEVDIEVHEVVAAA